MRDVECGKIHDFYLPPAFLRLFDGSSVNLEDMWRILGKGASNGGLVVDTIKPKPFDEACYAFWQGGDFIKNDEPMKGAGKLFSANITADDPSETIFGPYYHQQGKCMKRNLINFGGMNALRLPTLFENLCHSNVILTAGAGSFGHKDGPTPGAISCRQGEEEAWNREAH